MTSPPGFDRRLTAWLEDQAPMREPDGLFEAASKRITHQRRVPGWVLLERWLPMQTRALLGTVPRAAMAVLAVALLIGLASALAVASQPSPQRGPALPYGVARNGLIAYDSFGDIWVTRPDGTGRQQLTSGPEIDISPTWSPDGTRIAFWSFRTNRPPTEDESTFDAIVNDVVASQASLVVIAADGSGRTDLADAVTLSRREALPHWAPDSRRIAFAARRARSQLDMEIVSVDGAPLMSLGPGEDPNWAPDGRRIAFKGHPDGGSIEGVYLIDTDDPSEIVPVSGVISGSQPYGYWEPQWAPPSDFASGGDWIAFYGPDFDIWATYTVGRAGTSPADRKIKIASDPANEYFPMWASDGQHLVITRVLYADNLSQAVVIEPDGANPRLIESDPLVGVQLLWSPDGNWLLGSPPGSEEGLSDEMLILDAFGSEPPRRLAAPAQGGFSSWQRLAP